MIISLMAGSMFCFLIFYVILADSEQIVNIILVEETSRYFLLHICPTLKNVSSSFGTLLRCDSFPLACFLTADKIVTITETKIPFAFLILKQRWSAEIRF